MVEMKHYDELSRYAKGQATKQIHHEIKKYFLKIAEELTIEEAFDLTWSPTIKGWFASELFDSHINEYLISTHSRQGKLMVLCIYPREAAEQIIHDYCELYFNEIKSKKPTAAQLEYATGLQNDLQSHLDLTTDNYFVFVATLRTLIELHSNEKEQQKQIREQNYHARLQTDPATEKQLIAIQNSYNHFAKGKREIDKNMLQHLSKYEVSVIFELFKDENPLERVDNYLSELREKWS